MTNDASQQDLSNVEGTAGEQKGEAPQKQQYILTVRVEAARGLFRAPRDGQDGGDKKKDKAGKAAKNKKEPKKPGKGKKDGDSVGAEEELLPPFRSAIVLNSFPDIAYKPPETKENAEDEAAVEEASLPSQLENGVMSPIVETPSNSEINPTYNFVSEHLIEDRMIFLDNVCVQPLKLEVVQCFGIKEQPKGYSGPPQEDSDVFGTLELDLMAFLDGKTELSQWTKLKIPATVIEAATAAVIAANPDKSNDASAEQQSSVIVSSLPIPECLVHVSLSCPVLSEEERNGSNIATLTVQQLLSVPKEWAEGRAAVAAGDASEEQQLDFEDRFQFGYHMPLTSTQARPLKFDSNTVVVTDTQAVPVHTDPSAAPASPKRPPSTSSGRRTGKKEKHPHPGGEENRDAFLNVSVLFTYSRPSFLSPAAVNRLLESIKRQQPFELELTARRNGLDEKETEPRKERRGKCAADLKALLKPGATKASGSFDVCSVDPPALPEDHEATPKGKGAKPAKGKKTKEVAVDRPPITFQAEKTKLRFEITFSKPLIPLRPKLRVDSLLGPEVNTEKPQAVLKSTKADQALGSGIESIAQQIIQEMMLSDNDKEADLAQRQNELHHRLLTSGQYHSFIDLLRPLVVQVIKSNFFRKMPGDKPVTQESILNQLMVQMAESMSKAMISGGIEGVDESPLDRAVRLAHHNEQVQNMPAAARHHLDVLSFSESRGLSSSAYYDYALFSIRQGDMDRCDQSLRRAIQCDPEERHIACRVVLLLLTLELDMVEEALPLVNTIKTKKAGFHDHPLILLVRALYHQLAEEDETSWQLYREAIKAWAKKLKKKKTLQNDRLVEQMFGKPGTCPSGRQLLSMHILEPWCNIDALNNTEMSDAPDSSFSVGDDIWHECIYIVLARMLLSLNFPKLCYRVLTATRSRTPGEIGVQGPPLELKDVGTVGGKDELAYARAVHLTELYLQVGRIEQAVSLDEKAEQLMEMAPPSEAASLTSHGALHFAAVQGKLATATNSKAQAKEHYQRYLELFSEAAGEDSATSAILDPVVCLSLGKILEESAEEGDASAAQLWLDVTTQMAKDGAHSQSANAWLGVAAAAMAVGRQHYAMAEHALAQASVLDDGNAEVWGSIAQLALLRAEQREDPGHVEQLLSEACDAFERAMKYDLRSPLLLEKLELLLKNGGLEEHALHCAAQKPEIQ